VWTITPVALITRRSEGAPIAARRAGSRFDGGAEVAGGRGGRVPRARQARPQAPASARRASTTSAWPKRVSSARTPGRWRSCSIDGIARKSGMLSGRAVAAARGFRIPSRNPATMTERPAPPPASDDSLDAARPSTRPLERFWPYVDLPEYPTDEELAALDPDLREVLFGVPPGRFSISLVFPRFDGSGLRAGVALGARGAGVHRNRRGRTFRHRARFYPADALKLRDLFDIVGPREGSEVLIDDRPVPYARELWLPLVWFLIR
jgi:hypothetical protein